MSTAFCPLLFCGQVPFCRFCQTFSYGSRAPSCDDASLADKFFSFLLLRFIIQSHIVKISAERHYIKFLSNCQSQKFLCIFSIYTQFFKKQKSFQQYIVFLVEKSSKKYFYYFYFSKICTIIYYIYYIYLFIFSYKIH